MKEIVEVKLILTFIVTVLTRSDGSVSSSTRLSSPEFDYKTPTSVVSQMHKTVRLNCRIHGLMGNYVVWSKLKENLDRDVLSINREMVITDPRYTVIHRDHSKDWTLQIKASNHNDSGEYECQITSPSIKTYTIRLTIVDAVAVISGPTQVEAGSDLVLECSVHAPKPPRLLDWHHNASLLRLPMPQRPWQGASAVVTRAEGAVTSVLTVRRVMAAYHSGDYTCSGVDVEEDTLRVRVVRASQSYKLRASASTTTTGTHMLAAPFSLAAFLLCQR